MKTLYIVLLAVITAGVIGLVACSDATSIDEQVNPLADDEDKVSGYVYNNENPPKPVEDAAVIVYRRILPAGPWIDIGQDSTDEYGYYEFHLETWPAGQYGKVDATNDIYTGYKTFTYPLQGPVVVDTIYLQ